VVKTAAMTNKYQPVKNINVMVSAIIPIRVNSILLILSCIRKKKKNLM
jgi:hypothetical protein